jgi:hypothetical protein
VFDKDTRPYVDSETSPKQTLIPPKAVVRLVPETFRLGLSEATNKVKAPLDYYPSNGHLPFSEWEHERKSINIQVNYARDVFYLNPVVDRVGPSNRRSVSLLESICLWFLIAPATVQVSRSYG